MFFFRTGHAVVVLLVLARNLVFASMQYEIENNRPKDLSEMAASFLQASWIERIDSISDSESPCAEELMAIGDAFRSGETWAIQMLDASSKLQPGIMKGNLRDLGMYDQCVGVNGQYNGTNVQGQHCTVAFSTISSAICVPSSCNETDVIEIVDAIIANMTEIPDLVFEINGVFCVPVESEPLSAGEIVTIVFFATVAFFIIFCTVCEFVKLYKNGRVAPSLLVLAKFSLYANGIALMSTEVSPRMMPAIQGIRFLSTCWVVLGHRFLNTLLRPLINTLDILDWYNSWDSVYIQAAPFAVDTFFVISGFLMTYMFIKSKQAGKRSNYPMMYVHRYLRLTPCVAVLMLFVAVLLHRIANGPLWNVVLNAYVEPCRKNWWINFLYVQNLVRVEEMCLPHTWYLAVDMQLFWISPFILYPLNRWPKYGVGLLCLFLVASIVTPAVLVVIDGYSNALIRLGEGEEVMGNFYYFYIPTYNRACAYFLGLILGYDVAITKRHFTQPMVMINWIVAGIFMILCLMATQRIYNTTLEYDVVWETVFAIVLRPIWSLAIAWILYACTFGHGGPVAKLLSLPIFLPLSRLSYCIYLVHMVLQAIKLSTAQTPGRFLNILIVDDFWSDLVMSIAIAFVFSLFFESPVVVLEKMLTTPRRKPERFTVPPASHKDTDNGIDNKGMTEV